jgi:ParB family transcriptional regulator, chromosome partitioning protein
MARKNLLAEIAEDQETVPAPPVIMATVAPRPPAYSPRGAAGMVSRSLADIATKATAAEAMEARLTAGQTIIELDPALVDPSFVLDRMAEDGEGIAVLRQAIAAQGQNSPILVRPHPTAKGRYQAAFGHRRLRVAKDLDRAVRAVVKQLSDEDLVLAQGQENSARVDLSYIERALFAKRLEDLKYSREIIMAALGIDKAAASKMISVASRIPPTVIEAIGPAPAIGRPRWIELADQFERKAMPPQLTALLENNGLRAAGDSDTRFDRVFQLMMSGDGPTRGQGARGDARFWSSPSGSKLVKITYNTRACAMVFDEKGAPGFGDFVATQMDRLFADFAATRGQKSRAS